MGFGWMFVGYCLLLHTNIEFWGIPVDITPDILAFFLMYKGMTIASDHCDSFKISRMFAMVGIPLSLLVTTLDLLGSMNVLALGENMTSVLRYGYDIFNLVFTLMLLYSLYLISTQVEVDKLRKKAVRCAIYTVLFFFVAQSSAVIFSWFGITLAPAYISAIGMLADAICVVINATLIFGCYMRICLEGDEDMPDNREYKYKTPFEYFDRRRAIDEAEKAKKHRPQHKKKK